MKAPIVLLTDYGRNSPSIDAMKELILSRDPKARIIDLSHEVPNQDAWTAAFYLLTGATKFPKGTLFVTVLDPGKTSERRILWARTARQQFLFRDNGCISWVAEREPLLEIRYVAEPRRWRPNVYGAVAGALSMGMSASKIGRTVRVCHRMPFPAIYDYKGKTRGTVLAITASGSAITNIQDLKKNARLKLMGRDVGSKLSLYSGFLELLAPGKVWPGDPVDIT